MAHGTPMSPTVTVPQRMVVGWDRRGRACDTVTAVLGITRSGAGDDETADRWRLILNLARRHLDEWERLDMLAALVKPIYEQAKADALKRKADGGRKAAPGRTAEKDGVGVTPSLQRGPRARDVAAAKLAEEIERIGAPIAPVSGKTLDESPSRSWR